MADVAAMRTALEVDRDDLRTDEPPPLVDADGQFDPVARTLGVLRSSAVPALLSPLTETFTNLDLGAIDAAVYAFETGVSSSAALSATSQPVEDIEQGLERDGFEAQGNGRWVFPGTNEHDPDDSGELRPSDDPTGDPTGGFPAVLVEPGLFVMASSTTALDAIADADGADPALRALVDGAGTSWAIAAFAREPDLDPAACQEGAMGLAVGDDDEQVHALVLGDGDDVFRDDHPSLSVVEPTVVGDTTRYRLTPAPDGPAEQLVYGTLLDTAPFASC